MWAGSCWSNSADGRVQVTSFLPELLPSRTLLLSSYTVQYTTPAISMNGGDIGDASFASSISSSTALYLQVFVFTPHLAFLPPDARQVYE